MLKPGLGKGLGDLMQGDQVAGKNGPSQETSPALGRGLGKLIRPESATDPARARERPLLPVWFFFAADLLLLAFTVAVTFDAPRPFDFGTIVFCGLSVGIGAILAIVGIVQAVRTAADE